MPNNSEGMAPASCDCWVSRPDLREPFVFLYLVRSGCDYGGHSRFSVSMLVCLIPNCRQLSIIVSDWESDISCQFPFVFCGILSLFVACFALRSVAFGVLFICLFWWNILWRRCTPPTLHLGPVILQTRSVTLGPHRHLLFLNTRHLFHSIVDYRILVPVDQKWCTILGNKLPFWDSTIHRHPACHMTFHLPTMAARREARLSAMFMPVIAPEGSPIHTACLSFREQLF